MLCYNLEWSSKPTIYYVWEKNFDAQTFLAAKKKIVLDCLILQIISKLQHHFTFYVNSGKDSFEDYVIKKVASSVSKSYLPIYYFWQSKTYYACNKKGQRIF